MVRLILERLKLEAFEVPWDERTLLYLILSGICYYFRPSRVRLSVLFYNLDTKNVAVTVSISILVIWMLHRSKVRPYFIYFGI